MTYVFLGLATLGLVWGLVYLVRRSAHGGGNPRARAGADGYTGDSGSYATPFWSDGSDSAGSLDPGPGGSFCDAGGPDSGGYESGGGDSGGCDSGGGGGDGGGGGGD